MGVFAGSEGDGMGFVSFRCFCFWKDRTVGGGTIRHGEAPHGKHAAHGLFLALGKICRTGKKYRGSGLVG